MMLRITFSFMWNLRPLTPCSSRKAMDAFRDEDAARARLVVELLGRARGDPAAVVRRLHLMRARAPPRVYTRPLSARETMPRARPVLER